MRDTPVCSAVPQPKYMVIVKSYITSHSNNQLNAEFKNIWALFLQMHVGEAKIPPTHQARNMKQMKSTIKLCV
jgi:hypothetical protein